MPTTVPRIAPVAREEWTDTMRDLFAMFEGPEAREKGSRFKAIMTMANHPELAKAWLGYNVFLSKNLSLPKRLIEIVILRVAARLDSDYEWTQHAVIGAAMGLTPAEIDAIKQRADLPSWSELERICLRVVDEQCSKATVKDATWKKLAKHLDKKQVLELLFLIGTYSMLASVFNALRVEPEDMTPAERREVIFSPDNVYGQRGAQ